VGGGILRALDGVVRRRDDLAADFDDGAIGTSSTRHASIRLIERRGS